MSIKGLELVPKVHATQIIIWILLGPLLCFATTGLEASGEAPHQRLLTNIQNRAKETGQDSSDLELGKPNSRELAASQHDSYRLKLIAGQFALLTIDPTDIELVLTVIGPDGHQITRIACSYGTKAAESVYIVARDPGFFLVLVRASGEFAPPGHYDLRVVELRHATPKDRDRSEAQRTLVEGYKLLDSPGPYRIPVDRAENALAQFRKSLHFWKQSDDLRGEALSLAAIGVAYRHLGDWPKAADNCNRALRIFRAIHDTRKEASVMAEMGRIIDGKGDPQQAINSYNQAMPLFQIVNDRHGEYDTLLSIGNLYRITGELSKALEAHNRALSLSQDLNSGRVDQDVYTDIGAVYDDMGESFKALEYYGKALSVVRSAEILSDVGLLYVHLGQIQKALDSFRESLGLYKSHGDKGGQALIFNNVGLLYSKVGDLDLALDSFTTALLLTRAVRYKYGEGVVLGNLGSVYSAKGEIQKGLDYFNQSLAIDQEINDRSGQGVSLATIAEVHINSGELKKGLDYYNRALPLLRIAGDRRHEAAALINMGKAYELSSNKEQALKCQEEALSLAESVEDPFSESKARYGIAHVERDRGNLAAALDEIESAIKIVETLRTNVGDQKLRSSYFSSVREYYELYIDLLMQLEKKDPSKGYAAIALGVSERSRARSLLETLQEARADIHRGVDPHLLEREHSLQQLLGSKTERQMRLLAGQHSDQQAATVKKEIEELLAEYQVVEAQIRATSPEYAALTQPQPFDLAEIQKQVLDVDTVLLEYSLGSERSYLWAVTADSLASFQLPKGAEVEAAARRVYELLTARNRNKKGESEQQRSARLKRAELEYTGANSALGEMVLRPVAKLIRGKRLTIVADGALQYVPFGILPVPIGEENGARGDPLVVGHEVVSLPSASVLGLSRRYLADRTPAPQAVAVLADPVFDRGDARVKKRGQNLIRQDQAERPSKSEASFWAASLTESRLTRSVAEAGIRGNGRYLPRLVFTRQEAKSILAATPTEQGMEALDFDASRATATSAELGQYRMIHFATHGLLNSEHPELSGLVLSLVDEQGRPVDGFLGLEDVYNLNLSAELVTLSACETGLGKEVRGEGLVGLTRGFMYAGAQRVVASLWKVDDVATAELMGRFYRGMLQEGLRPTMALRQAQVQMSQQKRWADPYFWGAFTIQGEWR